VTQPRSCPLCGDVNRSALIGVDRTWPATWRICRLCQLIYLDLLPSVEALEEYYRSYYDRPLLEIPTIITDRLSEIIQSLSQYRTGHGRIVDFGFGEGLLLKQASAQGWDCAGTELDDVCIDRGRQYGWTVAKGDEWQDIFQEPFDVAVIFETIEHVPDHSELLRAAHAVLRPGGALVLTTPNGRSLNGRILGSKWSVMTAPEHLTLWSTKSLRRTVESHGFTVLDIRTSGFNPFDLLAMLRRIEQSPDARVDLGYTLQNSASKNRSLRAVKRAVQCGLQVTGLGDSVKLLAVKS